MVSWNRKRFYTWLALVVVCLPWTAVTGLGPKGFMECNLRLFLAVIGLLTLPLLFGALNSRVLIKLLILLAELSTVCPSWDIVNSLFYNKFLVFRAWFENISPDVIDCMLMLSPDNICMLFDLPEVILVVKFIVFYNDFCRWFYFKFTINGFCGNGIFLSEAFKVWYWDGCLSIEIQ